ncbi:hypothetical protein [Hyperthermus butylicus]|uniref:Uncharacterized protein n=1 Tax=Hyperthermus butylicus (strain DSM 5456 / JCM 9403 / PLM1-5) TaxID=415426 RepID=A2BLB1_HYPBU|nr:hypothetical protein [Hyperthermus butylicus]ABM80772.1 hypothetical protein Hbut_0924 [Hyperthermus butylicus DSM 5456]
MLRRLQSSLRDYVRKYIVRLNCNAGGTTCKPSSTECQRFLAEPNLPQALLLAGYRLLDCTCSSGGGVSIELVGTSGDTIPARLCLDCGSIFPALTLKAQLPLSTSIPPYRGPIQEAMLKTVETIAQFCAHRKGLPLLLDTVLAEPARMCKVKLGCRPIHISSFEKADLGTVSPRIKLPTILSWITLRLRKSIEIEAPWLCVESNNGALQLVCLSETCRFEVTHCGSVRLIHGKAIALPSSTRCSPALLHLVYLYGTLYKSIDDVNVKPCIWSMTGLAILGAWYSTGENGESMMLLVWNPLKKSKLHEIVFERHRIVEAKLTSPATWLEEQLIPQYNRLRIPLPPHGARLVYVRLRKLPRLLSKNANG